MTITQQKIDQYKVLITKFLGNSLTPNQFATAVTSDAIKMLEYESGGNGSTNTTLATWVGWLKSSLPAVVFFATDSDAQQNFQPVIDGTVSFTTAADALPSTYIALYNGSNQAALKGLLALRALAVDSTFKDDGANLAAGSAGNVLSDAYVLGRYAAWGAKKFDAIFNKGVLTAISNESNTSYDTIAEVAAIYSAWSNSVPVDTFFAAFNKLVKAGVTGIKFSDLMTYANNQTNFNKYTSDAAVTLMASTGGTFAGVTGLSAAEYAALTSSNALNAIEHAGATFTLLDGVYNANTTKYNSLLSNDSVNLAVKGYANIDLPHLSTNYGTTYTVAADVKYNTIVDPENYWMFADGITYAHVATAYDNGKLGALDEDVQKILESDMANIDANFNVLVGTLANYAGLEAFTLQ